MQDRTAKTSPTDILLGGSLIVTIIALAMASQAFILSYFWKWFIASLIPVGELSWMSALGIVIVARFLMSLRVRIDPEDPEPPSVDGEVIIRTLLLTGFVYPWMWFVLGALVHFLTLL